LAIPLTFLILFVSTLGIIAVTYYYAIERIDTRSQTLKVSMAKQSMGSFDEAVLSVLWQSGSSQTLEIDDCGGRLKVQPSTNLLIVNVTDNDSISDTIYDGNVGQVIYELPYSETSETGLFLKGNPQSIVNQSSTVVTQLYIRSGTEHSEILLRYRPIACSATYGTEDNKTINNLRIYVVNLNSSQNIESMGKIPLKFSCTEVKDTTTTYNVTHQVNALIVNASLDGAQGQVSVPITSNAGGAIINVELIVCKVKIEGWIR
jgi:hypothetical protein